MGCGCPGAWVEPCPLTAPVLAGSSAGSVDRGEGRPKVCRSSPRQMVRGREPGSRAFSIRAEFRGKEGGKNNKKDRKKMNENNLKLVERFIL